MSGTLEHTPADVLRYLLIDLGLGTLPEDNAAWPIYALHEPNSPDALLTVFDTAGKKDGRAMFDGSVVQHEGIQIKARHALKQEGFKKLSAVAIALDEDILRHSVTIGAAEYFVQAISRTSQVLPLGREEGTRRELFTVNAVMSMRQVA